MPASSTIQSLTRGLEVLEHVARAQRGLTLAELSAAMGLKPTTLHNLARSLWVKGYLAKSARPVRYTLGPAIETLAAATRSPGRLQQSAAAVHRLSAELPWATITYCQELAGEVAVLLRMSPQQPGVLEHPADRRMAAYASATALVFQAWWPDGPRQTYAQRYPFEEYGAGLWAGRDALEAFLAEVRARGYAEPPLKRELFRLAVPVFSPGRELVGALGVALPVEAVDEPTRQQIIHTAVAAAAALSAPPDKEALPC